MGKMYPLTAKIRAVMPFPTEHSFGRKSRKIFLFPLTPPRCLAIIKRNTLYSDNNNIENIVLIVGQDEDGARYPFYREP